MNPDARFAMAAGQTGSVTPMPTPSTKKPEEIVRVRRESGPLSFADPSNPFGNPSRLQESLLSPYAAQISPPITFGAQSLGVPSAPSYGAMPQASPSLVPSASFLPPSYAGGGWGATFAPQIVAWPRATSPTPNITNSQPRLPLCDIVDEGGEYTVQIELPGIKREGVDVSCYERGILVNAFYEPEIDVGALVQAERGMSISFRRAIPLPGEVQPSGAKATLHEGVLTVSLPKSNPTEGPRRVPVN